MKQDPAGQAGSRKVRAKFVRDYRSPHPENVFQVDQSPVTVAPGETLDIVIECEKGFSVYIPYAGFFGNNVFEAVEHPSWAPPPSEPGNKIWGVRLTRTQLENRNPNKEMAYCIYSRDHDNFAVGNSPPKMNLNP